MTLQQMFYLVALDNHRNFVRAAESCHVSQPTLSMQIQKLENEVGALLIDRTNIPLKPTPIGEEIILTARKVLAEINAVKSKINHEIERLDGSFNIGVIPTVAPYLLPLWLPSFLKAKTPMQLNISEMRTDEITENLKKGIIDIGILATPLEDDALREIPLYYEPFLFYLPHQHPLISRTALKMEQLNPAEMLLLEEGHCFRSQSIALCGNKKMKNQKLNYQAGSLQTIMGLVQQGVGFTLIPALAAPKTMHPDGVKKFIGTEPVREISLVVHKRFPREAVLEQLKIWIQSGLPASFQMPKKFKRITWL